MTRQTRTRLLSTLLLLAAVLGILVLPAGQEAYAAPPCEACELRYERCLAGTLIPSCGGSEPCCWAAVQGCYSACI